MNMKNDKFNSKRNEKKKNILKTHIWKTGNIKNIWKTQYWNIFDFKQYIWIQFHWVFIYLENFNFLKTLNTKSDVIYLEIQYFWMKQLKLLEYQIEYLNEKCFENPIQDRL